MKQSKQEPDRLDRILVVLRHRQAQARERMKVLRLQGHDWGSVEMDSERHLAHQYGWAIMAIEREVKTFGRDRSASGSQSAMDV